MIESVSTLSVSSSTPRAAPQASVSDSSSSPASPSNFVSSRVVVDNLQNVAILQYRSSQGDVVRQYPTEAQIQAFKRAEQAAESHVQDAKLEHVSAPSGGGGSAPTQQSSQSAQAAQPSTADIVAAAASYSPPAAPGSSSTQSTTA